MRAITKVGMFVLASALSGCASQRAELLTPESTITVEAALLSAADGLSAFQKRLKENGQFLGIATDEITLEFNLARMSKDTDKIGIDLSHIVAFGQSLSMESYAEASRGSTLKIVLKRVPNADPRDPRTFNNKDLGTVDMPQGTLGKGLYGTQQ